MTCIPDYQLGFRKGASTELQLCRFIDYLFNSDNSEPSYLILYDIVGAFDHVPQTEPVEILLDALKKKLNKIAG